MDTNRSAKKLGTAVNAAVVIVTFFVAATAPPRQAHTQDESIDVSCYKGNTDMGNYVGNLTVNTPQNAGQDCNSTYYDCQGQCLGCFPDSDLTEDVCYDNDGRRFLK